MINLYATGIQVRGWGRTSVNEIRLMVKNDSELGKRISISESCKFQCWKVANARLEKLNVSPICQRHRGPLFSIQICVQPRLFLKTIISEMDVKQTRLVSIVNFAILMQYILSPRDRNQSCVTLDLRQMSKQMRPLAQTLSYLCETLTQSEQLPHISTEAQSN